MIQPTNVLDIAFDGPDCCAKNWRVRQRFYQKKNSKIPSRFAFESISLQVVPVLQEFVERAIQTDPIWKKEKRKRQSSIIMGTLTVNSNLVKMSSLL